MHSQSGKRPSYLIALLLPVLSACSTLPEVGDFPDDPAHTIYLIRHGWHTGIIVRTDDIPPSVWPEIAHFPNARYLEVGWGDRAFYPAPDPSHRDALRAVLDPGPAVLHLVGMANHPARMLPFSEIIALEIGDPGFRALIAFIATTHQRDTEPAEPIGPGLYLDSRFYPAKGRFHLFNNCNTWVVDALRSAGLPLRRVLSAGAVIEQALELGVPLGMSAPPRHVSLGFLPPPPKPLQYAEASIEPLKAS